MARAIVGSVAGGFVGLCCAGFPLVLAFLTGIGLGFLISDLILFPILFVALGFMFYSLYYNKKKHLSLMPIFLAIVSVVLLIAGIFLGPIVWIGIIGMFLSSVWDYILIKRCKKC